MLKSGDLSKEKKVSSAGAGTQCLAERTEERSRMGVILLKKAVSIFSEERQHNKYRFNSKDKIVMLSGRCCHSA